MSDNVTPLHKIQLNVDTLERESAPKEPFRFGATIPADEEAGTAERQVVFSLTDPSEVDWDDLAALGNPVELLRYVLPKDQRDDLIAAKIPGWKFQKIMEAYVKHFGMDLQMGKGRLW